MLEISIPPRGENNSNNIFQAQAQVQHEYPLRWISLVGGGRFFDRLEVWRGHKGVDGPMYRW